MRRKINRPSRSGPPAGRINILALEPGERAALHRGQRVTAGPDDGESPVGTFIEETAGCTVILWDGSPAAIVRI